MHLPPPSAPTTQLSPPPTETRAATTSVDSTANKCVKTTPRQGRAKINEVRGNADRTLHYGRAERGESSQAEAEERRSVSGQLFYCRCQATDSHVNIQVKHFINGNNYSIISFPWHHPSTSGTRSHSSAKGQSENIQTVHLCDASSLYSSSCDKKKHPNSLHLFKEKVNRMVVIQHTPVFIVLKFVSSKQNQQRFSK